MKTNDSLLEEIDEGCRKFRDEVSKIRAEQEPIKFYFGDFELGCPYDVRDKCDKIKLMRFNWVIPPEKRVPEAIVCNNCLIFQSLQGGEK